MRRVLKVFYDKQQPLADRQKPHVYEVGEVFPLKYEVKAARLKELEKAGYISAEEPDEEKPAEKPKE